MIFQTATTMDTLLTAVTAIVTSAGGWITTFVGKITSEPLLLMFVIFGFIDPVGVRSNPIVA